MKSDRLLPSASAARSISVFCLRVARRLIVSPRVAASLFTVPAKRSLPCVYIHYTFLCARCKYIAGSALSEAVKGFLAHRRNRLRRHKSFTCIGGACFSLPRPLAGGFTSIIPLDRNRIIRIPVEDFIRLHGARVHNLKNISLSIPHEKLTVITGVSGSG